MNYIKLNFTQDSFNIIPGTVLINHPLISKKREVIVVVESAKEGHVGFILNNKTGINIGEVLPDLGMFAENHPLFQGGETELDTLHMLHNIPSIVGGNSVTDSLYWGGSYEALQMLIKHNSIEHTHIKLLVGYTAWLPNVLEKEITEGKWLKANINPKTILSHDTKDLWNFLVHKLGGDFKFVSNVPKDIALN